MEILSLEIMESRFYNFWYRDGSTMVALACSYLMSSMPTTGFYDVQTKPS